MECTQGTLQIINGLPKGYLCEKNLNTHQTQVVLSFINFQQVSDKTTCEAFSIPGLPAPDDDAEKNEPSTKANGGLRSTTCECGWANQVSDVEQIIYSNYCYLILENGSDMIGV